MKSIISIFLSFVSIQAFAWGGRGHDSICEAAVFLVQNENLKDYLLNKPHMMGHLCNIPDIYWRGLSNNETQHGNPTHYINPEALGLAAKDTPLDMKVLISKYTGQENMTRSGSKLSSVPLDMGTNWWRADQFFRLAVESAKEITKSTAPANSKEEQDDNFSYNKNFYNMIVSMGLMGHYVGDNGQPFHVTSDHDGYAAGHGGIHAYYEDASVAYFGPELQVQIVAAAKKLKKTPFLTGNTLEKMRALGEISASEVKDILKVDPVTKPSTLKVERGMSLKTPAERKSGKIGHEKFKKFIVTQMGRSALLLAHLWDEVYKQAGQPEIKAYKSYRYPLTPDFVYPDYYEIKKDK